MSTASRASAMALALVTTATPVLADASCRGRMGRSPASQEPATLVISNVGRAPLILDWIDFEGGHKTYATIQPGGRHVQQTYVGHVWTLVTQVGNCVRLFRARPGETSMRAMLRDEDRLGGD